MTLRELIGEDQDGVLFRGIGHGRLGEVYPGPRGIGDVNVGCFGGFCDFLESEPKKSSKPDTKLTPLLIFSHGQESDGSRRISF